MQSFRAKKPKLQKSSKPPKKWTTRHNEIVNALKSNKDNIAMVACSECVKHNVVCYYDRRQSVQCAACLRHQRNCDSTFSLEEFQKVGVQKKKLESQAQDERRRVHRLWKTLIEAWAAVVEAQKALSAAEANLLVVELANLKLSDSIAQLDKKSGKML